MGHEGEPLERKTINTRLEPTVEGCFEWFRQSRPGPGVVGLYCCGSIVDEATLSAGFVLMTGSARLEDDTAAFPRLLLLSPFASEADVETFRQEVMESVRRFLEPRVPAPVLTQSLAALNTRLQVSALGAWELEPLVERVRACEPRSAVLVLATARLYSPVVALPPAHTAVRPAPVGKSLHLRMAEDAWVPRVVRAVEQLAPIAESQGLYLVLWTGEAKPGRMEHRQHIEQLPCDNIWLDASHGTAEFDQALTLAREGRLDEALRLCEAAELDHPSRVLLKANCYEVAGQAPLAYGCIAPFLSELLKKATGSRVIQIARWALLAGRYSEGCGLLDQALASPEIDESFFDMALGTAEIARNDTLKAKALEGLRRYFPNSRALRVHEASEHFEAGRHAEVVQLLSPLVEQGDDGSEVWLRWLISRHHQTGPLDYERLMREVLEHKPTLADAAAEYWFKQTIEGEEAPERIIERAFAHPWGEGAKSDAIGTLLLGVERMLLASGGIANEERIKLLERVLERSLDYLSTHPGDDRRRRQLVRLMEPSISGGMLLGLVHFHALSALPWWKGVKPTRRREAKRMAQEHMPAVLELVFREMPRVAMAGAGTVPVDKLPCPPEEVLAFFLWALHHAATGLPPGEEAMKQLTPLLHFALLFARIAGEPNDDIRVRAMGAASLCVGGDFRNARDLMETMLLGIAPSDSSQRRRVGWLSFGDFCLRAHSLPEALLALACANRCPPGLETEDDLFHECRFWIRLLRDLGHFEPALKLLSEARLVLHRTGLQEYNLHHLDYLETGIQCGLLFQEFKTVESGAEPSTKARFLELCERLADANRRARSTDGEFQPGMLQLGQLIAIGAHHGLQAPEQVRREFEELLPDTGTLYEPLIKAVAEKEPVMSLLGGFSWGMEKLRETGEIGNVIQQHEFLARRELTVAADAGRAADALYLLEWSMDRSLRNVDEASAKRGAPHQLTLEIFEWAGRAIHAPGGERSPEQLPRMGMELQQYLETERGRRLPRRPPPAEECEKFVLELSRRGVPVHVLGLDERRELIRVSAVEGKLSAIREPSNVFDPEALHTWAEQGYPAKYAAMDSRDPNGLVEVERTLARLGISAAPSGAALLVPTTEVQPIPPNLILVGGELAGSQMAVASVPSLSWLRAAHATPRERAARRGAWIPTSDSPEEQGTLAAMREDIREHLDAHGLVLSCEPQPAKALAGADLVFIGAHGSLSPEGLFFRVVADERSARFSARELALSVSSAGVVILAICNGARVDRSPFTRATVGLGRLLLDHGCRAVIGSPWSLDISVLRRWLPTFLKSFDAGATVLEANHAANQAVAERFNRHPAHALAMNLLGDPFFTR